MTNESLSLRAFEDLDQLIAEDSGLDRGVVDTILMMILIIGIEEFDQLIEKARRHKNEAA